jgi:predicted nucleotidyltransferase
MAKRAARTCHGRTPSPAMPYAIRFDCVKIASRLRWCAKVELRRPMDQMPMHEPDFQVLALARKLGEDWPHLAMARERARKKRQDLRDALSGQDSEATSIVVFGSLARDEFTAGSDIDWTLLVDGYADAQHLSVARQIGEIVKKHSEKEPGPEATFGSMAWSHQLVHLIGGEDDTNQNTTRRILMLLESTGDWQKRGVRPSRQKHSQPVHPGGRAVHLERRKATCSAIPAQ